MKQTLFAFGTLALLMALGSQSLAQSPIAQEVFAKASNSEQGAMPEQPGHTNAK